MSQVNEELKKYISENIFPQYEKNEKGHNIEHINYVINRSLKFAQKMQNINLDIVYTVASFHDIGHHIDPKNHEKISAQIMMQDKNLAKFFTEKDLILIKEAIEDHRASSKHEPRSIYGKIVSSADRNTSINSCLVRTYCYGKNLYKTMTEEQLFERSYFHLKEKYGDDGYAKNFFEDEEYEAFLKELRTLLLDKQKFVKRQKNYIFELKKEGKL